MKLFSQKKFRFALSLTLFLAVLLSSQFSFAVTRTWDNEGGDGLWSNCTNWSGNTCPGAADIAQFNNTNTSSSTVDVTFGGTVDGVLISAGYTGTITQSRSLTVEVSNFVQGDGTWNGSTHAMTITGGGSYSQSSGVYVGGSTLDINDGSYTLSGGTFNHPSTTFAVERNFTISGGTYNGGSKTITFDDSNFSDVSTIRCTGNLLSVTGLATIQNSKDSAGGIIIDSGCEVNTALSSTNGTVTINSGGTLLNIGDWASSTLTNSGALIADAGTFTVVGETSFGGTLNNLSSVSTFNIDNGGVYVATGKTLTVGSSDLYIEKNLTVNGTFSITGKNLNFDGGNAGDDTTLNCTGNFNTNTSATSVTMN